VLARFGSSYYAGEAALTEHRLGEGRVLHLGGALSREAAEMILDHLGLLKPFADIVSAPQEIELAMREKNGKKYLFMLNYKPRAMTVTLHEPVQSLFTGETLQGEIELASYSVEVVKIG